MYKGRNKNFNRNFNNRPRRKPRTRLERIEALKRRETSLTRKLKGRFQTSYDMFDVLSQLESVQKEIEIQTAYEQYENSQEEAA